MLEQVEQAERGLLVDGVVQLALGVQPAHALLAVAGDQRPLDRTDGASLRARGQALLPAGFLIPYFMAASFRTVMYRSTLHTHRLDKLKDEHRRTSSTVKQLLTGSFFESGLQFRINGE